MWTLIAGLPRLIGPADGGAGNVVNPWPAANALLWGLLAGLLAAALAWGVGRMLR